MSRDLLEIVPFEIQILSSFNFMVSNSFSIWIWSNLTVWQLKIAKEKKNELFFVFRKVGLKFRNLIIKYHVIWERSSGSLSNIGLFDWVPPHSPLNNNISTLFWLLHSQRIKMAQIVFFINISVKSSPNSKRKVSFEIYSFSAFQNWPYFWYLAK